MAEEKRGKITKSHKDIFWGLAVLVNLIMRVVSLQYTYIKTPFFHSKYVQFTVCRLYLNKAIKT